MTRHSADDLSHGAGLLTQDNSFKAARSRYAEDELAAAVGRGATQCVILGAALDTSAYRNSLPRLRVFEVDDGEPVETALKSLGFRHDEISFVAWLGAPNPTAEATVEALALFGSLPKGSSVVLDYAVERQSLDSGWQTALDALASRFAKAGECLRLLLDTRALHGLLRAAGFHRIEDLGPDEINTRYFADAEFAHLVRACV